MSLWHKACFELKIHEKQHTQEGLSPLSLSALEQGINFLCKGDTNTGIPQKYSGSVPDHHNEEKIAIKQIT